MDQSFWADLSQRIRNADDTAALRALRDELHRKWDDHLLSGFNLNLLEYLNDIHDLLIQRTVELSETRMKHNGFGTPPVSYAFVLFGSGGRREQTLWSDQDNGLIYSDGGEEQRVQRYFQQLADHVQEGLIALGYPLCEGNVLASSPAWRHSLSDWKALMRRWFDEADWESVRYLLILADARCVHGDHLLLDQLKNDYLTYTIQRPGIRQQMLANTLKHKVLVGLFGQLLREPYGEESGGIDIKYGAYIPLVNAVRLLAIRQGLTATSTSDRLEQLIQRRVLHESAAEQCSQALMIIFQLRLKTNIHTAAGQFATSGKVAASFLDKAVIRQLKAALRSVHWLQKFVKRTIRSEGGV